jgi:hypothetical protein
MLLAGSDGRAIYFAIRVVLCEPAPASKQNDSENEGGTNLGETAKIGWRLLEFRFFFFF